MLFAVPYALSWPMRLVMLKGVWESRVDQHSAFLRAVSKLTYEARPMTTME
jgi:hypothetical protein